VSIDWTSARRVSYLVEQSFRYEYPAPIRDLRHRLVVIPPERFGDQRRIDHRVEVGLPECWVENRKDDFGNLIVDIRAPAIAAAIEFRAEVRVERQADEPHRLADGWLGAAYLLQPSLLTAPDARLERTARELAQSAAWGFDLADRINDWVYQSMSYQAGVTSVKTTAAEALAVGHGVCQDYAHVMLALCRACGLPARYVSGHLIGEGGTHAWVEVVLPAADGTGDGIVWPFDPTHASRGGLNHVTIAVGGDYLDVAPTSGTYVATVSGRLTTRKRVVLTELELTG
jgi:transglutaminase-like putative cysteine protease